MRSYCLNDIVCEELVSSFVFVADLPQIISGHGLLLG